MTTAVNGASERRSGSSAFPILTAGAGAATGAFLFKKPLDAKYALAKDELNLSDKAKEALKKDKPTEYNDLVAAVKSASSEEIAKKVKDVIPDEATKEVDAAAYLKDLDGFKAEIAKTKEEIPTLEKAIQDATDAAVKKAKQIELDGKKAKLAADETLVGAITKEGKLSKEAITEHIGTAMKSEAATKINKALEAIGDKLPKVFSGKNIAIGAVAGLAVGWIISRLTAPKAEKA